MNAPEGSLATRAGSARLCGRIVDIDVVDVEVEAEDAAAAGLGAAPLLPPSSRAEAEAVPPPQLREEDNMRLCLSEEEGNSEAKGEGCDEAERAGILFSLLAREPKREPRRASHEEVIFFVPN